MVSQRTALISSLADDISCGHASGRYDYGYFLDGLLDSQRVTAHDVAILATLNEFTDAHIDTRDRMRELVEAEAVKFFSDTDEGKEYVSDLLAAIERDRETERRAA